MTEEGSSSESDSRRDWAHTWWPDLALIGVATIWGVNIPLMKNGLDQIDIFVFNALRLTISAAVLAAFAIQERRRRGGVDLRLYWKPILVYSVVVSAIYQLCFLLGIARTTSGNTALIISTVPMWTALLARVFIGEQLHRMAWAGLTVALLGTMIVALQKGDISVSRAHLVGNVIILLAALMWSAGTVYSRPLLAVLTPLQLSASAAVLALPAHLLFAVGRYEESLPALRSPELWAIIIYSGMLSSGLALSMWNFAVRHAGASHAAVLQNLVPVIAIIAAWIARGEAATLEQIVGGMLILGGLVMMRIVRKSPAIVASTEA